MFKKKQKRANKLNKAKNVSKNQSPSASFFGSIGIKPIRLGRLNHELEKVGFTGVPSFKACNSHLATAKVWWGAEFNVICRIANELSKLKMPASAKVLDVGGGPGHIAFWLSHIWPDCQITVVDDYSKVGMEWAQEIGTDKVEFIDDCLPELKTIESSKYDVVLLARVLANTKEYTLPTSITSDWDDFSTSQNGKDLISCLQRVSLGVNRVMIPEGTLIVIDSWSSDRVLLVGKAFENSGLYINPDLFDITRVSMRHSSIVFSKSKVNGLFQDLPTSLATMIEMGHLCSAFNDMAAMSLKMLFDGSRRVMEFEYLSGEHNASMKSEIHEKNGLAMVYRLTSNGARKAFLFSAAAIPFYIEEHRQLEAEIKASEKDKVIQSVTVL